MLRAIQYFPSLKISHFKYVPINMIIPGFWSYHKANYSKKRVYLHTDCQEVLCTDYLTTLSYFKE